VTLCVCTLHLVCVGELKTDRRERGLIIIIILYIIIALFLALKALYIEREISSTTTSVQ